MKSMLKKALVIGGLSIVASSSLYAFSWQDRNYQLNQFEAPHDDAPFEGPSIGVHGDLSFYVQNMNDNYNGTTPGVRTPQKIGFSLPVANLDISARLARGFNVVLQTRLASHHHHETYVKGGYATIESLDFIGNDFLDSIMKHVTVKVGVNDIDFGDNQFTRTDNANTYRGYFTINQAVESNVQAVFGELLLRYQGAFLLGGLTTGLVNPVNYTIVPGSTNLAGYFKLGYDSQLTEDFRLRISESGYFQASPNTADGLFNGTSSLAGSALRGVYGASDTATGVGTWNPMKGTGSMSAYNTSLFLKYKGTELTGVYEFASGAYNNVIVNGRQSFGGGDAYMNHVSVTLAQRFWDDKMYVAARYEKAFLNGRRAGTALNQQLDQAQVSVGWYMYKGVLARAEYIWQQRNLSTFGGALASSKGYAYFQGFMLTANVAF
ncbi:hypothetical protein [Helicobacter sp. 11S02629-2]|uniref:hypothetical protein n=1 Tax=Helicobacter sp. 11S02629-2 TaxID=1476195 RepID=UPI000BA753F9|nr:hypothetical protein [Helicobacter sp. 11S02629-2]PAF46034.1 hypothetical protein BKH40_01105 [Helicobacter sp. 11S02629-2]